MAEVNDWVIKVGLDLDKVEAGKKRIEKMLLGIEKLEAKAQGGDKAAKAKVVAEKSEKRKLDLVDKRNRIESKILSLKAKGATEPEISRLREKVKLAKDAADFQKIERDILQRTNKLRDKQITQARIIRQRRASDRQSMSEMKAVDPGAFLQKRQRIVERRLHTMQRYGADPKELALDKQRIMASKDLNQLMEVEVGIMAKANALIEKNIESTKKQRKERVKSLNLANATRKVRLGVEAGAMAGSSSSLLRGLEAAPATDAVKRLRTELTEVTKRAERLQVAFSKVRTKGQMEALVREQVRLRARMKDTTEQARTLTRALRQQGLIAGGLTNSFGNMVRSYASVFAVAAGAGSFFRVGKEFQSIEARMLNASGSAQQMGKDFNFLTNLARVNGQAILQVAQDYSKFGAATSASGFSLEEQKRMFQQITEINTAYQLTPANAQLAGLAIEQMVSKGVLSTEELRRQLGK